MRVQSALELEDNRTLFKSASMNAFASTIGFIAATLTTIAFVPQVIKVWRSRSARDVSLGMYVLFTTGVAVWLLYGFLISSWPVILANAITLVLAIAVIVMKLRFDGR
jgi:MtN3 and saliva related transmembrane protein